jgi:hypothetical protein
MNRIVQFTEKLSDWSAWISAVILGLMTVLILVEILLWNTLGKTTLIADEYSAYGLAAIIFLGGGYCLKERGHIRITLDPRLSAEKGRCDHYLHWPLRLPRCSWGIFGGTCSRWSAPPIATNPPPAP